MRIRGGLTAIFILFWVHIIKYNMQHEIALFFDNEEKNLVNARGVCPNVVPIKVPDTVPLPHQTIAKNCVTHYNALDEGARRFYACLITAIRLNVPAIKIVDHALEIFDNVSGINDSIMDNTINAMNDPGFSAKYKVTTCIFDIDRTIIKNEGFLDLPGLRSMERIKKMMDDMAIKQVINPADPAIDFKKPILTVAELNNLSLKTNLTNEKDKITIQDVAHCFLGGVDRTNALVRFFGELRAKNVDVVFLTNNQLYCTSPVVSRACPSAIDVAAPVTNPEYNWLFYDFMSGAGIITADKDYFIANMMIYNNNGSAEARVNGPSKYNRIHNMQMDGTMADHKLKQACKTTLGGDMDKISTEIKGLIEDDFVVIGGRKKTRKTRARGKKTRKTRKTRARGKKTKKH